GGDLAVVSAIPYTPALLGSGVNGLFATPSVDTQQHARAEQVLASAGRKVWIYSEGMMDSVNSVSVRGQD
ncbi:pyrroline-5-carboxylate reductase, partial [Stenotrophomonas maltophilia]